MLIQNLSDLNDDVLALGELFSEMSQKGMHLKEYEGDLAYFEPGAPEPRYYQAVFQKDIHNATLASYIYDQYKSVCKNKKKKIVIFELSEEQYQKSSPIYTAKQLRLAFLLRVLKNALGVALVSAIAVFLFLKLWSLIEAVGGWLPYVVYPVNQIMPVGIIGVGLLRCGLLLWNGWRAGRKIGQRPDAAQFLKAPFPKRSVVERLPCVISGVLLTVFCAYMIAPFGYLVQSNPRITSERFPIGTAFLSSGGYTPKVQIDFQSMGELPHTEGFQSSQTIHYQNGQEKPQDIYYRILYIGSASAPKLSYAYEGEKKNKMSSDSQERFLKIEEKNAEGIEIQQEGHYFRLVKTDRSVLLIDLYTYEMPDGVNFVSDLSGACKRLQETLERQNETE